MIVRERAAVTTSRQLSLTRFSFPSLSASLMVSGRDLIISGISCVVVMCMDDLGERSWRLRIYP